MYVMLIFARQRKIFHKHLLMTYSLVIEQQGALLGPFYNSVVVFLQKKTVMQYLSRFRSQIYGSSTRRFQIWNS